MFASAEFLQNYLPIVIFLGLAAGLSVVMLLASFLAGKKRPYKEKLDAYECGFDAFDDARDKFDVRFYLVSILFVIFDLEVAFIFPWAVILKGAGPFVLVEMVIFLAILVVGLAYAWGKRDLEWIKLPTRWQ